MTEREMIMLEIIAINDSIIENQKKMIDIYKQQIDIYKRVIEEAKETVQFFALYNEGKNEQEYCDRNICKQNEYNGVGCDECVINHKRDEESK